MYIDGHSKKSSFLKKCLIKQHAVKMFYKVEEYIHAFLTRGTDKSELLDSNSDSFTTR